MTWYAQVHSRDVAGEEAMMIFAPPQFFEWFSNTDDDNDGVISGEQAVKFFMRTELPKPDLAAIWNIVTNQSDKMTKIGFILACYLVGLKQNYPQIDLKTIKREQIPAAVKKVERKIQLNT